MHARLAQCMHSWVEYYIRVIVTMATELKQAAVLILHALYKQSNSVVIVSTSFPPVCAVLFLAVGYSSGFFSKCWFSRFTSWQCQNYNPRGNMDRSAHSMDNL